MKCSKCYRPAKGHQKPLGDECTLPEMTELEKEAVSIIENSSSTLSADAMASLTQVDLKSQVENEKGAGGGITKDFDDTMSSFAMMEINNQLSEISSSIKSLSSNQVQLRNDLSVVQQQQHRSTDPIVPSARERSSVNPHNNQPLPPLPSLPHRMHANPSSETKAKAIRGEYIVLEEFAPDDLLPPSNTMEPYTDNNGTLSLRPKKPRKILDSFDKWLAAWDNYELLLVNNGHDYSRLAHHRATIQMQQRKYIWSVVYAYDVKYRLARAVYKSTDFSKKEDLYNDFFDASALKTDYPRCRRCRSTDHMVADCPFPAKDQVEKKTPLAGSKAGFAQDKWFFNGKEGCNTWNVGKCRFNPCSRAHVCKGCRGYQPQYLCTTCSSLSSQAPPGGFQGGTSGSR